jgi:phosphatidylserine/phosphatidylglycerophosphate/cardiolipin synthase-like enzyme
MFRAVQVLLGALLLSLVLSFVPAGAVVGDPWTPPVGVTFNDPTVRGQGRVIVDRVIRAIQATPPGESIRIVVWNLDDRRVVDALIDARQRLVTVQVIMSADGNDNWLRLKADLNEDTTDDSFAHLCTGACRSSAGITHAKIFLFSKVNTATTISMFGSTNLTAAAGSRQWNDLVTARRPDLYDYWVEKFAEFAADVPLADPYEVREVGPYRSTLFPAAPREPVVDELDKVRCKGATDGTGNGAGRTEVRVAIAGWFDTYGSHIASRLRELWDRGCDVKIVTTLTGRGVNRVMRQRTGRGPVPMREVTVDRNADKIPERYLHLKLLAISGVYAGDTAASVVFTGSPNWSARAQRSDEVWVRILGQARVTRQYQRHVDHLYALRIAHARSRATDLVLRRAASEATDVPRWYETD